MEDQRFTNELVSWPLEGEHFRSSQRSTPAHILVADPASLSSAAIENFDDFRFDAPVMAERTPFVNIKLTGAMMGGIKIGCGPPLTTSLALPPAGRIAPLAVNIAISFFLFCARPTLPGCYMSSRNLVEDKDIF